MVHRKAYILCEDANTPRCLHSTQVLENIGFTVIPVPYIRHSDKVYSNLISMQSIYETIANDAELEEGNAWSYVFEDDISALIDISLDEVVEYEHISQYMMYLGVCTLLRDKFKIYESKPSVRGHPVVVCEGGGRGLHAIGLSRKGAQTLYDFSKESSETYMDCILQQFTYKYPANIVRYDLESYIWGHRGIIYQDRKTFPTTIG